jgi:small GTP-binding protein
MASSGQTPGGDCDYIFKIIVIGDSGVGKSSLTVRLSEDVFYKDYASTIAIDFRMHQMTFMEKKVRLQIWDTAGQERFQSVATAFYRGANGVMMCFDLTHRPSFQHLDQWLERVRQQALPGIPCILIGCKLDEARANRQVSREEASAWAQQHSMGYIETSAKEKENVIHAFQQVTLQIFDEMKDRNGGGGKGGPPGGKQGTGRAQSVQLNGGSNGGKSEKKEGCSC